jgi:hypothetical protein
MGDGGGGGGGGAISYDGEEAWSSIKYSILSGLVDPQLFDLLCLHYHCTYLCSVFSPKIKQQKPGGLNFCI